MPIPKLMPTQSELVQRLHGTGPQRWAVKCKPEARAFFRACASTFLQEQCEFLQRKGLIVSPSANLHHWHAVGWRGPVVTSHQFLGIPAEPDVQYGTVVFDEQAMYSEKFLLRLDELLTVDAQDAIFIAPGDRDEVPLHTLLARHRFVLLNVN